ncbi:MAG: hypothetical protein QNJ55_16330 [Xenococcus sp. MO_188.B8]|nr:hypothetical protein [Xenococcus sp. MO_188.B8]
MMKSIIRWTTALGIVGVTVLSSDFNHFKALALPNEQIAEILNPVPVFTIANEEGVTLTLTVTPNENEAAEDQKEESAVVVFMSHQHANDFINTKLKTENPELAGNVSVNTVPLGRIFEESQKQGVQLTYVPTQESLDTAKGILEGEGKEYKGGVPLFFVKDKNNDQPFLFGNENKQVFPLFFEKARLDNTVEQVSKQDPDFASNAGIEVIPLEQVLATLQQDDDEALQQIELVISTESQEFIRQNFSDASVGAPALQGAPASQESPAESLAPRK